MKRKDDRQDRKRQRGIERECLRRFLYSFFGMYG